MQTLSLDHYRAIIWDCDGVLIDSEILACSAAVDILVEKGAEITLEDYLHRFMGKSNAQILKELGISGGFPLDDLRARQNKSFAQYLKATPGIHDVLNSIALPMAIASGSALARLEYTLGLTGLLKYFSSHIYSAETVKNGKPAPDIFLLAAEKLGVTQPRLNELLTGKLSRFSLDALVDLASAAGIELDITPRAVGKAATKPRRPARATAHQPAHA